MREKTKTGLIINVFQIIICSFGILYALKVVLPSYPLFLSAILGFMCAVFVYYFRRSLNNIEKILKEEAKENKK